MGAATVTSQEWGFNATGGTDATTVTSGRVRLNKVIVTSVGTAAGTATITSVTGTVPFAVLSGGTVGVSQVHDVSGAELDGIILTLSGAGHVATFIVE